MNKKERRIWNHTIRFLAVFRHLEYRQMPMAPLLMRDFQRWCRRHYKSLPVAKNMFQKNDIQAACARYWPALKRDIRFPKKSSLACTLVRANLYPMIQGRNHIYIAHGRKEYNRCLKFKSCRPLILLSKMPYSKIQSKKLIQKLNHILRSKKLPRLFRRTDFQKWIKNRLRLAVKQTAQMNSIFTKYSIKRVIYGSTLNRQGVLAASVAQSRSIPVVNIQHGIFGVFGHIPVNANLNLVWGPSHKSFLTAHGAPSKRIKLTTPTFYRSDSNRIRSHTLKTKNKNKPTVLVALQPLGNRYNRRFVSTIERAAKLVNKNRKVKYRILYKLHPDQGAGRSIRPKKLSTRSKWIPHRNGKLNHLLDQSHVCITPYSTVALESYIRGVPVLFYGPSRNPYYLRSVPPHFQSARKCISLLRRYFAQKDRHKLAFSMLKDAYPQLRIKKNTKKVRKEVPHESTIDCDHTRACRIESPAEQKQDDTIWETDDCPHADRCEKSEVDRADLGYDR